MLKWALLGAVLILLGQVEADCGDGPMYWCDSCETVKQCSFLLRDMIKVCLKIGLLTEQDCPELITDEVGDIDTWCVCVWGSHQVSMAKWQINTSAYCCVVTPYLLPSHQGEEATSLPPTENAITAEPPTMSADDLPDIITEKVIQQILTEAYGPAMSTVATSTEQSPEKVAMTTEEEEEEAATDFPYGVTEADGDFRNPRDLLNKFQPFIVIVQPCIYMCYNTGVYLYNAPREGRVIPAYQHLAEQDDLSDDWQDLRCQSCNQNVRLTILYNTVFSLNNLAYFFMSYDQFNGARS
uniref:Putative secretory peptide-33 n=1 Tax=Pleurobrachia bachei TaxID=34499 RepID=M4H1R3_PLEBA|nr:putative secretory peptide-33 [Pleurobrachia bachei]|eukprot:sb/3467490/